MSVTVSPAPSSHEHRPLEPLARRARTPKWRGGALVVAFFMVMAALLATLGGSGPTQVLVVGNSIASLSAAEIETLLSPNYAVQVDAVVGATMHAQLPTIISLMATRPDDVVVELGTNDANGMNPDWAAAFDQEVDALRSARCVVLVNVNTNVQPPNWSPAQVAVARQLNEAMATVARQHSTFHVLDWDGAVAAHPGAGWVDAGQIHPTPAGRRALAHLIATALRNDCHN